MKKISLLILAMAFATAFATAQNVGSKEGFWGVRAGVNFSNLYNENYSTDYQTGFCVGGLYSWAFTSTIPLRLESGLSFQMKGARDKGYLSDSENGFDLKTYSFAVPVVLNYEFQVAKDWAVNPFVGLYYSFALGGSVEDGNLSYDPYKKNVISVREMGEIEQSQLLSRSDFGLRVGLSVGYQRYLLGFCYDAGFINSYSKSMSDLGYEAQTGSYSIFLGYNF